MKVLMLTFAIICLTACPSQASWYVVDANNKVVVKCEYQPDAKDLQSRNEVAVFSGEDIPIPEAEYRNGKIIRHTKTPSELTEERAEKEKAAEAVLIDEKIKAMAVEELKSEGTVLKYH